MEPAGRGGTRRAASEIVLSGPHLVVLMGAAGAGKSTFAERWFKPTQIVSTDRCRALVGDREEVQAYSRQAFELFYFLIAKRMELNKLVVADSTALGGPVRRKLLELAREHYYPAVLVAFTADLELRRERNVGRPRRVPDDVLVKQQAALEQALRDVAEEGWDQVYTLSPPEAERVKVVLKQPNVRSSIRPPYDVIGDIHGCYDELLLLLDKLGWQLEDGSWRHPHGRTLISIGDLADRGPKVPKCFDLWRRLVEERKALFVPGNHDNKLLRHLVGRPVQVTHGLERSLAQLDALPPSERHRLRQAVMQLIAKAPPYYVLDGGRLVVAHAGIKREMIGKLSRRIVDFTLYGDVTGRKTPDGLPERRDWASEYCGSTFVVYGHTPVAEPVVRHNTVNIDQGCVFGGALTALRYPEMAFVQVPARRAYYQRAGWTVDVDDEAPTDAG